MKRTDIHAPSNINPNDYIFVAALVQDFDSLGSVEVLIQERKILNDHMQKTGGKWSTHEHGGNCHICGAYMIHEAIFYHEKTNVYIRTGFDCAEKMDMGDSAAFKKVKDARKASKTAKAGVLKAQGMLEEIGLWKFTSLLFADGLNSPMCRLDNDIDPELHKKYNIYADIVSKLVRYGNLSEKQWNFLHSLKNQIENFDNIKKEREEIKKEREKAKALIPDAPTGRVWVSGTIISIKEKVYYEMTVWKWTVETEEGYKVWSTIPSALLNNVSKGDKVRFKATLKPSDTDSKFAFGSRPASASVVEVA